MSLVKRKHLRPQMTSSRFSLIMVVATLMFIAVAFFTTKAMFPANGGGLLLRDELWRLND